MKVFILAGGSGTRLWPLSRESFPKQFLRFGSPHSLLQQTVLRFLKRGKVEDLVIITQEKLGDLVSAQLRELDPHLIGRVAFEPAQRGTALAILAGLDFLRSRGEKTDLFLVTPSDHLISPEELFLEKIEEGAERAKKGALVTFGVYPTAPHTGYGYIHYRKEENDYFVEEFIEKPSIQKAESMLSSKTCFWNAGIFLFEQKSFLKELGKHQPEMVEAFHADFVKRYPEFTPLSIDYALFEHAEGVRVVPLPLSWSDVGSWDSFHEVGEKDNAENVTSGNVILQETKNSLVLGDKRLICTLDVEDLIIIDSEDALLITKRGSSQKIRTLVDGLKKQEREEAISHPTVHRPWGSYTILEEGEGYKIKRIVVAPGARLSLQYHLHRSEHWVVTESEATITLGEEVKTLKENESLFVPKETPHRLANETAIPLEIIEVQVGSYVGEDDIVRLDDVYGRVENAPSKT